MRPVFILITLFLSLLTACTPYQSQGLAGGYTETWLAEDVVRVRFNGNGYTSSERAADFSLLRVAEIGRERGYPYFVLLSEDVGSTSYQTPTSYNLNRFGNSATITQTGGYTVTKPRAENTARLLKAEPRGFPGVVYEASFICRSITQKYEIAAINC
ncbi:MAG: CC0125/CC1285 family lipoprotein [Yoonia sp.]|uniref:CC0125/CC1285 family lipoprotein n=1 Tax=Yoonia sp. TaxID=2212373 RepID=UPI003EF5A33F